MDGDKSSAGRDMRGPAGGAKSPRAVGYLSSKIKTPLASRSHYPDDAEKPAGVAGKSARARAQRRGPDGAGDGEADMTGRVLIALMLAALAVESVRAEDAAAPAVGEITVTAQRREEKQEDVPISITVQTGEQLRTAGVDNLRDLALVTPGLTFQAQGNYVQPALRGITTLVTGPGSDNPIALYVDGVYEGTQAGASIDLPDVERIEVSKGPQGTLFGRNATGGAIQIFTKSPSFEPGGKLSVIGGYYDGGGPSRSSYDIGVQGFVTGPIVADKLAASLSFAFRDVDGYSRNVAFAAVPSAIAGNYGSDRMDWIHSYSARAKLLFTPSDRVSILATAYYMQRGTDHGSVGLPVGGLTAASLYPDAVYGTKPWQYAYDAPRPLTRLRNYGGSLKIDVDTGAGTFTSTTAYTQSRYLERVDVDAAYSPQCLAAAPFTFACLAFKDKQPNNNFFQDFLFTSEKMGRLSFIVGGNIFLSNGSIPAWINDFTDGARPGAPQVVNGPLLVAETRVKTRAFGIFAEADYEIVDRLTLTAGVRYSYEKKKGFVTFFGSPLALFANPDWNNVSPRVGLRYQIDAHTNVYATFSRGFKSGILPILTVGPAVNPEKVSAWEVGFKTARRRFNLNVAGFYYDYKNLQIQSFTGTAIIPTNAASARIYGVEFDGTAQLTQQLSARLGATWMPKADFTDFPNAAGYGLPITAGGLSPIVGDVSGDRLLRAPRLSAVFGLTYTAEVSGGELTVAPSVYYSSKYLPYDPFGVLVQKGYARVAAEVSYRPDGSGLRVSLWGRNLTNTKSYSSTTISAGAARVTYDEPREIGLTIDYDF
ncbi:MAG: TonB-dependent receptor [Alphaproteobacteria bacterium]|nr:TonB-dependent receptor [Alphaproteobacteria bacterium]